MRAAAFLLVLASGGVLANPFLPPVKSLPLPPPPPGTVASPTVGQVLDTRQRDPLPASLRVSLLAPPMALLRATEGQWQVAHGKELWLGGVKYGVEVTGSQVVLKDKEGVAWRGWLGEGQDAKAAPTMGEFTFTPPLSAGTGLRRGEGK